MQDFRTFDRHKKAKETIKNSKLTERVLLYEIM